MVSNHDNVSLTILNTTMNNKLDVCNYTMVSYHQPVQHFVNYNKLASQCDILRAYKPDVIRCSVCC